MRRAIPVLATLAAILAISAAPVAAASKPVLTFHDRINETIPDDPTTTDDDLCGVLPVTTRIEGVQNGSARLDAAGHLLFKASGRVTVTWTNEANGLSVTNPTSGQIRDIRAVDNPDGSTTIYTAYTGIPERLITPGGVVAVKDVGRLVIATTIDLNDPDDPADDEVTAEIVSVSGPHPEAASNFELFCEVVIDALT